MVVWYILLQHGGIIVIRTTMDNIKTQSLSDTSTSLQSHELRSPAWFVGPHPEKKSMGVISWVNFARMLEVGGGMDAYNTCRTTEIRGAVANRTTMDTITNSRCRPRLALRSPSLRSPAWFVGTHHHPTTSISPGRIFVVRGGTEAENTCRVIVWVS